MKNNLIELGSGRIVLVTLLGCLCPFGVGQTRAPKPPTPLERSPELTAISARLTKQPITLGDAISVALTVNPLLARAGENLAFAQGRVDEAKSAFMPNVSLLAGGQYISRFGTPLYTVQATLPLDISRLISASTAQAGFQEVQARLDINRTRNEIVYRVENAFYTALRAKALTTVADENLGNTQERLRDAQARYKARAVAYIDVVRAQTDVAEAQKEQIQAKSGVDTALGDLANAMGIEVTTQLEIVDTKAVTTPPGSPPASPIHIPTPDEMPSPGSPTVPIPQSTPGTSVIAKSTDLGPEFRSDLREALATRPEVLEADAGIAAARKGVLLAQRSDLPSLAMGIGYFKLRTQSGSNVNEPQAFIGINIPVFDGGLAKSRVLEAKATVDAAVTSKREAIDAISLDVQHAYLAEIEARDEVTAAAQALLQAHVAYDLAKVRYTTGVASRAGISPLIELSDAQAALTLAEQNQVNALYDYNGARAQLDRSVGRFAYPNGASLPGEMSPNTDGKH